MFVLFICSILTTAAQVAQAHSAQSNETDWMQHNIPLASDKYIKNLTDVFLNMKDVSRKNQIDIAKNLSAPDAGECDFFGITSRTNVIVFLIQINMGSFKFNAILIFIMMQYIYKLHSIHVQNELKQNFMLKKLH